MRVLVVVPTLGRRDLGPLVRDIAEQRRAAAAVGHEVDALVLHNGSESGPLRELVIGAGLAYDSHAALGFSQIRNEAVGRAVEGRFDVLVMIDDDERPDPGWLPALLAPFAAGADVAVGPVRTAWPPDAPQRFIRSSLPRATTDPPDGWIDVDLRSGNCAIRVDRLDGLRFDDRFDAAGGEDTAMFRRLRAAGARCYWVGAASVTELVDPSRVRLRYFARRAYGQGRSYAVIQRLLPRADDPRPVAVLRLRAVRAARLGRWSMTRRNIGHLFDSASELAFALGYVIGRMGGHRG